MKISTAIGERHASLRSISATLMTSITFEATPAEIAKQVRCAELFKWGPANPHYQTKIAADNFLSTNAVRP